MLQPARTKYRKAHKGRIHGQAGRGEILNYGSYGLKAMEPERIVSNQILDRLKSADALRNESPEEIGPNFPLEKDGPDVLEFNKAIFSANYIIKGTIE